MDPHSCTWQDEITPEQMTLVLEGSSCFCFFSFGHSNLFKGSQNGVPPLRNKQWNLSSVPPTRELLTSKTFMACSEVSSYWRHICELFPLNGRQHYRIVVIYFEWYFQDGLLFSLDQALLWQKNVKTKRKEKKKKCKIAHWRYNCLTSLQTQHCWLTADLLAYLTFDTRSVAATDDREAFTLSVRPYWRQMLRKKGCTSGTPKEP